MKWFKHYHNASSSVELNELIDKLGISGYGHYWLLLELLTEKYDGESTQITLHFEEISRRVRIKYSKKLETLLQLLPKSSLTFVKLRERVYKFDVPILSELKSKDFKRARSSRKPVAFITPLDKDKEKEKEKDIYIKPVKDFTTTEDYILSWNALEIIDHKINDALLEKIDKNLKAKLKKFTKEEILQAMKNYKESLDGWFTHKWTFSDFLIRKNSEEKFFGENYIRENYINANSEEQKINDMASRPNPFS